MLHFHVTFINDKGQFLITKRAHTKKVWHGVWTNSCCGHPYPDEDRIDAVKRRLDYELGIKNTQFLDLIIPKYIYKTPPYNGIIEHEYCPVYVAVTTAEPIINPEEVDDYKWVEWDWYVNQLKNDSDDYSMFKDSVPTDEELGENHIPKWSWWCKDQLKILEENKEFKEFIDSFKV
jgi:isopentenyl-diphosphate delta-isomerase type 1